MRRKFVKGPTLEKIEEFGITRHAAPEDVEVWQLISAAELLFYSDFMWAVSNGATWAAEEVTRLEGLTVDTGLDTSLEVAVKSKKHALSALRCAVSLINKAETDWIQEQERRNRASGGSTDSRRKSEARKERKRARDREVRNRMKNTSGKKDK